MSRGWCLSALLLLGGCAQGTAPDKPAAQAQPAKPVGVFKVLETPELVTYFAANSLSLYQGNPNLRQFYMINNYSEPTQLDADKPLIHSSRALLVINCERDEKAQFGRVYFSEPFAQGVEVLSKSDIPQWTPLERQSILGEVRNMICVLDPARLRPPAS